MEVEHAAGGDSAAQIGQEPASGEVNNAPAQPMPVGDAASMPPAEEAAAPAATAAESAAESGPASPAPANPAPGEGGRRRVGQQGHRLDRFWPGKESRRSGPIQRPAKLLHRVERGRGAHLSPVSATGTDLRL